MCSVGEALGTCLRTLAVTYPDILIFSNNTHMKYILGDISKPFLTNMHKKSCQYHGIAWYFDMLHAHRYSTGIMLDVRYLYIYGPSLKLHAILVCIFLTSIAFEQNGLQS